MNVLQLDAAGTPQHWLDFDKAAYYLCSGKVAWSVGEPFVVLRGGTNAASGRQSTLELPPIIAVRGEIHASRVYRPLSCVRERIFRRDLCLCAYCGQTFRETELTVDHVTPQSRGGPWSFKNCVSACAACNTRKRDRTPEEARMPLIYVPYEPNVHESFLLEKRHVIADQMQWLQAGLPVHSRLRH